MIANIASEAYENFHEKSHLPNNMVKLHMEKNSRPNGGILEHLAKDKMEENVFMSCISPFASLKLCLNVFTVIRETSTFLA